MRLDRQASFALLDGSVLRSLLERSRLRNAQYKHFLMTRLEHILALGAELE
jgi:hypothetical protein